jgi:dihydrofolate reductase
MGKLISHLEITVNGAFEAPTPDDWVTLDNDSSDAKLEQLALADALVLGRKTYEGLAVVWPQLADDPAMGRFAGSVNSMPKYVASRTLSGALEWNATVIKEDLDRAVPALKAQHSGNLILSGGGELAHDLARRGFIDEYWFWIHPSIWASGPRVFDGVGPVRLQLVSATPFRSGVVWLRYRPANG